MFASKRKLIGILLLMSFIMVFSATPAMAYVDYELLSVYCIRQQGLTWCWAACTQMICYYLGTYPSQADIVDYAESIGGGYGTMQDVKNCLNHWNIQASAWTINSTYWEVVDQISAGQPVVAGRNEHAEVIYGYYTYTEQNKKDIYFCDPYPSNDAYRILSWNSYYPSWTNGTVKDVYVN